MGLFDEYYQEKKEYDESHRDKVEKVELANNPNFSLPILKQNIEHIDDMTDAELKTFLSRAYRKILVSLFDQKELPKYIQYFQNVRFIDAFIEVLSTIQFLERDEIVRLNTLCYHYLTLPEDKQDYMVVNRMIKLSSMVNRYSLPRLLGLGLPEQLANMLLIARYSDINLNICVKRVDFIIITQPKELMNQEMIHQILLILYDTFNEYYMVFPYMMMDIIPEFDEDNEKTWWVTDDVSEVNSVLNLAMLEVLNDLPTQEIRKVILNYSEGKTIVNSSAPIRFSLKTLSDDYYRINNVTNYLTYNEHIFVP